MENTTGFFEESPGNRSANRLIFIIGMVWLMLMCSALLVAKIATVTETTLMFGTISGILYGGKLIQKVQELKNAE
jgi:hypothetical protein